MPDPNSHIPITVNAFEQLSRLKSEVARLQNNCDYLDQKLDEEIVKSAALAGEIARLHSENAKLKQEADLWKLRSDNWQKFVQLLEEERLRLKKAGTEMGKHLPDTDEANKAYRDFEAGGQS